MEPTFDIFAHIYLTKENGVSSEQTFIVAAQVLIPPGLGIEPATPNDDYHLSTFFVVHFFSTEQS